MREYFLRGSIFRHSVAAAGGWGGILILSMSVYCVSFSSVPGSLALTRSVEIIFTFLNVIVGRVWKVVFSSGESVIMFRSWLIFYLSGRVREDY